MGVQLTRHLGRGCSVVHQDGASVHTGKGPIAAQHHAAQVIVVAHAAKHDVRALCRLAGCVRAGMCA